MVPCIAWWNSSRSRVCGCCGLGEEYAAGAALGRRDGDPGNRKPTAVNQPRFSAVARRPLTIIGAVSPGDQYTPHAEALMPTLIQEPLGAACDYYQAANRTGSCLRCDSRRLLSL